MRQQRLGRRLNGLPRLDPLQARNLFGRQKPPGVAQFNRKHELAVVVEGDRMGECRRAHSFVVPSRRLEKRTIGCISRTIAQPSYFTTGQRRMPLHTILTIALNCNLGKH